MEVNGPVAHFTRSQIVRLSALKPPKISFPIQSRWEVGSSPLKLLSREVDNGSVQLKNNI